MGGKKVDITEPQTIFEVGPKGMGMFVLSAGAIFLLVRYGRLVADKADGAFRTAASGATTAARGTISEVLG